MPVFVSNVQLPVQPLSATFVCLRSYGTGSGVRLSLVSTHRDTQALITDQSKQSSRCSDCSEGGSPHARFRDCSPKGYQHVKRSKFKSHARARVGVTSV
mgnify:CR=1 FL=1